MRYMNVLTVAALLWLLPLTSTAYAHEERRIYLPEDSIELTEEGYVFILDEEGYIPIDVLYEDDEGFFVYQTGLWNKLLGKWDCPACGKENPYYIRYCHKCEYDNGDPYDS